MKNLLSVLALLLAIFTSSVVYATEKYLIPLSDETKQHFFQKATVLQNDPYIKIKVPDFADNPAQVPIFIDASFYKNAQKMIVFADLNLIQSILEMKVIDFIPTLSVNIKVAQSTPLRVAVLDKKNIWHLATVDIHTHGGGCSVEVDPIDSEKKKDQLGKSRGKVIQNSETYTLNFSIFHPMETGLFFGKSEFYINNITISDTNNPIVQIKTYSAISENPRFKLTKMQGDGKYTIMMHDTDGNTFTINPKD